jgi:hypothetical protein
MLLLLFAILAFPGLLSRLVEPIVSGLFETMLR